MGILHYSHDELLTYECCFCPAKFFISNNKYPSVIQNAPDIPQATSAQLVKCDELTHERIKHSSHYMHASFLIFWSVAFQ